MKELIKTLRQKENIARLSSTRTHRDPIIVIVDNLKWVQCCNNIIGVAVIIGTERRGGKESNNRISHEAIIGQKEYE